MMPKVSCIGESCLKLYTCSKSCEVFCTQMHALSVGLDSCAWKPLHPSLTVNQVGFLKISLYPTSICYLEPSLQHFQRLLLAKGRTLETQHKFRGLYLNLESLHHKPRTMKI